MSVITSGRVCEKLSYCILSSIGSISMSMETLQQSNESSMGSSELAVSIPLSAVSIIGYVLALGVLLYYKMWRSFIYRLVLYLFISLIFFSVSMIIHSSVIILPKEAREITNATHGNDTAVHAFLDMLMTSSLAIAHMLVTCIIVCICYDPIHNLTRFEAGRRFRSRLTRFTTT